MVNEAVRFVAISLIMVLFAWPQILSGALIQGTVTDDLTKAPVESVKVAVQGTAVNTYTNASGQFSLTTSTGVYDAAPFLTQNEVDWQALNGALVYGVDGSLAGKEEAGRPQGLLAGLADGVYFVRAWYNDCWYTARVVKNAGTCRAGRPCAARAKAGATVTLVYSHKYYTTKEAAANEGDLNVATELSMWWPDETNTGVPAGTNLTTRPSGRYIVSQNGAVIENLDIVDCVEVNANNVTIRKCRIHVDTWYLIKFNVYGEGYTNLLVEDCELDATNGQNTMVAIAAANYTLRRCNIHGGSDGPRCWAPGNVLIEDCYVHDLWNPGGAHNDAVDLSEGSNATVRHCTIYNQESQTSCITAGADNSLIEYNIMAGGGYSIYGGGSNVRIVNNVFSKKYFPNCGYYGVRAYWDDAGNQWSGNVWYETGQPCQ